MCSSQMPSSTHNLNSDQSNRLDYSSADGRVDVMTDDKQAVISPGKQAAIQIRHALHGSVAASHDQIFEKPLGPLGTIEMAASVVAFVDSQGFDRPKLISAINLAADLHSTDLRYGELGGDRPYIVHPLRNTIRLIRWGATNESLLIASILHDTVEDHPFELAAKAGVQTQNEYEARNASFIYLATLYGQDAVAIVEGVSNPIVPPGKKATLSRDEWHKIYAQHVQDATGDSLVFACKVSDFIDNTVGSPYDGSMGPDRELRMAKKYLPVCDILLQRLDRGIKECNLPIKDAGVKQVRESLELARKQLSVIVNRAL